MYLSTAIVSQFFSVFTELCPYRPTDKKTPVRAYVVSFIAPDSTHSPKIGVLEVTDRGICRSFTNRKQDI